MKIITLPAEIEVLNLDQISDLIADALCPIESDDAEGLGYQLLRIDVDKEVTQDARAGLLLIRHPQTRKLQTTPTPAADILDRLFQPTPFDVRYGVVLVADAVAYVAERGITLLVQTTDQTEAVKPASDAPEQSPATPAPVVPDEVDLTMVATRTELIEAFGKFTDMDKSWFDNLNDAPKLMAARKFTGQGGRNSAEPLFCPYEVTQWLADPKRKKGRRLNDTTAWRLLKSHFPKVYNQYSIGDPNTD